MRVLALAIQGLTVVVLARSLGARDFGAFSLVLVVQSLIAVVSNLGILTSGQYHVGRRELSAQQVATAGLAATAAGSVLLVPPAAFMLSWLYPTAFRDLPLGFFVLAVLAGPIRLGYEALFGVFIGTGDVRGQSISSITGPAAFLAILAIAGLSLGLSLPVVVGGWFLSQVAVLAVSLVRLRRHGLLLAPALVTRDPEIWTALLRVGLGAYASYVAYWVTTRVDRIALSVAGGAEAVGIFSVAAWVAESFALLPMVVGSVIYPSMAVDTPVRIAGYLPAATRAVLAASGALAVPTLAAFGVLAIVLGDTLGLALPVLAVVLPGYLLFSLFGIFINFWVARGRTATAAVYYLIAGIAKSAVVLALYDEIGLLGVAAGLSIVGAVATVVAAHQIARDLGVRTAVLLTPGSGDLRRAVGAALDLVRRLRGPASVGYVTRPRAGR